MLKLKPPKKRIVLRKYPYTYARTSVMKSLLFKKQDYQKMLKMGFSEIAKYMQETNYKKEINELAGEFSGAELLEQALNKNLANIFKKLIRISPGELELLIREYAKRKDIEDIKTILRGKFTGVEEKEVLKSITSGGTLSNDFFHKLFKKDSIEEVLRSNSIVDYSSLEPGLIYFKEKNSLMLIENALDRAYYNRIISLTKNLPTETNLFKKFLLNEIEVLNILSLLSLKKSKVEKAREFIITAGGLIDPKITKMAEMDDLNDILKLLQTTRYKGAIESGIKELQESGSLITLENEMYKHLLKQNALLLHQSPLSPNVILGFMLAKDIEVRNLRILVKGKQLGLDEIFIEKQLVY
jgi:V/A-type H+/Na+-transporting ATPase subunit C